MRATRPWPEDCTLFNFGENWRRYSNSILDATRVDAARDALMSLVGEENIRDKRFLDVGCGSGIVSIAAAQCSAAEIIGIDVSAEAVEVSRKNAARFGPVGKVVTFRQCSILDPQSLAPFGQFDTVYAWGSLHHTGRMWDAITQAAKLVSPGGILVLAIYNQHVTSPAWKAIKWSYNWSPRVVQRGMVWAATPVIAAAKFAVTGHNPWRKARGMDFLIDVVDWVGGYPYEYARPEAIERFIEKLGFDRERVALGATPTACNEFVFRRKILSESR
jgi:2-polyprenyl-6-hydroxyphenyl methylase/3-demethylubiquinone-9 3-methyltransferase